MTNWQDTTTKTYDNSAEDLAEYFKGIGPRKIYIDFAFKLINDKKNAKVVEIGCGDGRDAVEIVKRTGEFEGFDPSAGMINLAKKRLPDASFVVADALSYDYPDQVDIIFAFASLLHVDRDDLRKVFVLCAKALAPGGLFYISLKESDQYTEKVKKDQFGERMFYYYSVSNVLEICGDDFESVLEIHETIGSTKWFELGLRRI